MKHFFTGGTVQLCLPLKITEMLSKITLGIIMALLSGLLCACSTGNTVVIGKEEGSSALRLTDNGLYIDPSLLGLPQGSNIEVHTSPDSGMTFNVEKVPTREAGPAYQGQAF